MSVEVLLFFLLLFLLTFYFIHERLELFQLFTRLGISGPSPNFFVGNMMQLTGKGRLVVEVMDEWERKYGPFYGYYRGTRAVLVVRDSEVIKDILVRNTANFINRPHMVMNVPPIPDTVVGLRGQRWKEVRQILSPSLSSAKIKHMFPIMSDCVKTTLEILREKHKREKSVDQVVDAHILFQGLACEVISVCALAMKVNSQRNPQDKFIVAVKGFLENAMGPFVKIALCFPLLAKLMGWALKTFGYSHEMTKMIMENVRTAMQIRRENNLKIQLSNGNGVEKWRMPVVDVLQLMMEGTGNSALTDEEIVANAWVFILGGFETTSAALSFTCYLLSIHQDIQEKLFDELKRKIPLDEIPTYEQISELTYLDQVICESLRLYPPVVNFIVRGLEQDCRIGPYLVPKNVGIQIPIWNIHHDPISWPQPYKFDPDRFANNSKKAYANNMQWIPFGSGPRNCLGARFAQLNLKFTLSTILRNFRVEPESQRVFHHLKLKVPSVTIVPDGGVPLRFIPRDK